MSLVAVSVEPSVEEVHEMAEILNRSVRSDPAMDPRPTVSDNDRLLQSQSDGVWVHEFAEVNE